MDSASSRRHLASIVSVALVALVLPLTGIAVAAHTERDLEVVPEFQKKTVGTVATLTATICANGSAPSSDAQTCVATPMAADTTTGEINIDFEIESPPNNTDGNTPTTPDLTCTIPVGSSTCSVTHTANSTGDNDIRAWIDHDQTQTTVEADEEEGLEASEADCEQNPEKFNPAATKPVDDCSDTDPAANDFDPTNPDPYSPGQGCPPDNNPLLPGFEPDCTDVVRITWQVSAAGTLDCDDAGAPDREREVNPASGDTGMEDDELYTCRVTDQFGNRTDRQVFGEVENGVNDPDTPDAVSYTSPDYTCGPFGDVNPNPLTIDRGCEVTVDQLEGELGTAEICWWAGERSAGATLCADEATGESQVSSGVDAGNDLADQVEKTWQDPSTFTLDCTPETDTNPTGTPHTITCSVLAQGQTGQKVNNQNIDVEISGDNDPDAADTRQTPDLTCTTKDDGTCSVTHTGASEGTTTYIAWIDADKQNATDDSDSDEGRDEVVTPGAVAEPDNTDVMEKEWLPPPSTLQMTPESDTATVGDCNPYTITVADKNAAAAPGVTIDVEQRHSSADSASASDDPVVKFCVPSSGPNPSNVDTSKGDLVESPDNKATAGGETTSVTNANGQVTIGIAVDQDANANGAGTVTITAFFDPNENDDPDTTEPKDTSTKQWQAAAVPIIDCEPESATSTIGEPHTVTCTVKEASGNPESGEAVTFTEEGAGEITSDPQQTSDANGQVSATVNSNEEGSQTITATTADNRTDTVSNTWEEARPTCPGYEGDARNQVVGTSGADVLTGTSDADIICALGGNDTVSGRGGNDVIIGGRGSDTLRGNGGNDRLKGGPGNDNLSGGKGNDALNGGRGRDTCNGGPGKDTLRSCE